jgi:uncharacterized RDD family membrane protein YckC
LAYEGVLLFGVLMISGYLFSALTQQRNAMVGRTSLQWFVFVVLAIYFVWFWSRGGQTVAMKAWHVRVVDVHGAPVGQLRALSRYVLAWMWFVPALCALYLWRVQNVSIMLGALAAGVVAYAALSFTNAQRQYWHDMAAGTRLIDARLAGPPETAAQTATPPTNSPNATRSV